MASFISIPVETDETALLQLAYAYLMAQVPGWKPVDPSFEAQFLEALARMAAQTRDTASDVPRAIFRYFGSTIVGIPPDDATYATVDSTWTMQDTLGHTVPAGTVVNIRDPNGTLFGFVTTAAFTVTAGNSVTADGAVTLRAALAGADYSNIDFTDGAVMILGDALGYVASVVPASYESVTSGGVDAETDDEYLVRLSEEFQLLSPRIVTADDATLFALSKPVIGRAMTIDGYDLAAGTTGNTRTYTTFVADVSGNSLDASTKADLLADMQDKREVNFLIYVGDPTYSTVDVTYSVVMQPGFTSADIVAAVNAALTSYFDPGTWGSAIGESNEWVSRPSVYYLDVTTVIRNVQGVDHVVLVTVGLNGGSQSAADHTMTGVAPLPRIGILVGTAS